MNIRPAEPAELAACLEIYNHYVEHSVATFDTEPMAGQRARAWCESHQHPRYPALVAEEGGKILAYGCLSRWSMKAGYDPTAEVSVFVAPAHQRRGAGTALLGELLQVARRLGHRNLLARIEAENAASIALFAQAGFRSVGVQREAGFKFGRWLDVELMERLIEPERQ